MPLTLSASPPTGLLRRTNVLWLLSSRDREGVPKAKDEQLQHGRLRPGFDTRWSQEVTHPRDAVGTRWIPKEKRQGLEPDAACHWGP